MPTSAQWLSRNYNIKFEDDGIIWSSRREKAPGNSGQTHTKWVHYKENSYTGAHHYLMRDKYIFFLSFFFVAMMLDARINNIE